MGITTYVKDVSLPSWHPLPFSLGAYPQLFYFAYPEMKLSNIIATVTPANIYRRLDAMATGIRGHINLLFFRGNAVTCPICRHSFKRMLPGGYHHQVLLEKKVIGGGRRINATCPYCFSMDRERLIHLFLETHALLQEQMKLLHIAPEKHLQQTIRGKNISYVAADLNSPYADFSMNIQDIPYPDHHFDAIICNHVLEHVPDDALALKELYRILKTNGWAIIQAPFSPLLSETFEDPSVTSRSERKNLFGQSDHVRIYGVDYADRLRNAGFEVRQECMSPDIVKQYALLKDEVVFFCKKP